jgi:hypothetical protein
MLPAMPTDLRLNSLHLKAIVMNSHHIGKEMIYNERHHAPSNGFKLLPSYRVLDFIL